MFDNPEIKGLRQDIDALTEQVAVLLQALELRHQETMARLDLIEEKIDSEGQDIEDAKATLDSVQDEVTELAESVQNIDDSLGSQKENI